MQSQTEPTAQASSSVASNPLVPALPKEHIEDIIYGILSAETDFKKDGLRNKIAYRNTPVSFDNGLQPHQVHPAFWTFQTYTVPWVTISSIKASRKLGERCFGILYDQVFRKQGMRDAVVSIGDEIYGPRYVRVDGAWIKVKLGARSEEVMNAKARELQKQSQYAQSVEERGWCQHSLYMIRGLVAGNGAKQAGV
ncbi:hypothetical protein NUW58_g6388 [Xylaria curta]|uniref:Uncharacterized protein n=1 Tax=Xylaria curta TaxID=42375 RepID=A0ACC1NTQ2_9PEZI|nr:hypothetical protein NUW58_g6388 [Xylaria curta]